MSTPLLTRLDDFRAFSDPRWGAGTPDPHNVALYAPYDQVHEAMVTAVKSAQSQIVMAMYGFDDEEFAKELAKQLKDPRVHCQIMLDKSQAGGVHEKKILSDFSLTQYLGNQLAIGTSEHSAIMHRKMICIDGLFLITGSTNLSESAETKQDNQLFITDHPDTIRVALMAMALEFTKALHAMSQPA